MVALVAAATEASATSAACLAALFRPSSASLAVLIAVLTAATAASEPAGADSRAFSTRPDTLALVSATWLSTSLAILSLVSDAMAITLREYSMPFSMDGAARSLWIATKDWTSLAPIKVVRLDMVASKTERAAARFNRARRSIPSKVVLTKNRVKLMPDLAKSSGLVNMVNLLGLGEL